MSKLEKRIDFVYLLDVQDGNPNGDPDAGNLPRVDAETGMGLITDVCLKRKVRNYVQTSKKCSAGYDIFIKEKAVLDDLVVAAYETEEVKKADKSSTKEAARIKLCKDYYDIRTFGAVIATKDKQGQVRGPIQLTFSRSVDPIVVAEHSITRMAVTKKADEDKERTMGRKATIPYGLYVCHGFISANLAKQTGFGTEDLMLFWDALINMFECDHSAARGLMSARKLYVFEHATELGNAPASSLFDRISIMRKDISSPARSFSDYQISVNQDGLEEKGIKLSELIDGVL